MAATSLLGCGRVAARKTLQLETWGLRSCSPSLSFCTKSQGSKKGPEKNVVAPQESTKLLATKTAVEFPKKLFPSSHPPSGNKGETKTIASTSPDDVSKLTDEDVRKFLSRKTLVGFPERITLSSLEGRASITTKEGFSEKLAEEESSSSSESDSSSDSDEEDSASEVATKTRVAFPRREPFFFENRTKKVVTLQEEGLSQEREREYVPKKKPQRPEMEAPYVKQIKSGTTATANSKILESETREPAVKQSPKETNLEKTASETQVEESQKPTDVRLKETGHLVETSIGATPAAPQLKVPPLPHQDAEQKLTLLKWEGTKTREGQETETQRNNVKLQDEFLKDTTLMVNTTTEEIILEAGAQTEEQATTNETKTAAASSQEEFDNSTYKNLQHHEYNTYTFVDFDVELSKFRQPQPSSGRLSPRH